jgi:hypothetical protein
MGCEDLDYDKVNLVVRNELQARGITETTGPGGVMSCQDTNGVWDLRVVTHIGASLFGQTFSVPDFCKTPPGSPPLNNPDCAVPADKVVEILRKSDTLNFVIRAQASEVER